MISPNGRGLSLLPSAFQLRDAPTRLLLRTSKIRTRTNSDNTVAPRRLPAALFRAIQLLVLCEKISIAPLGIYLVNKVEHIAAIFTSFDVAL